MKYTLLLSALMALFFITAADAAKKKKAGWDVKKMALPVLNEAQKNSVAAALPEPRVKAKQERRLLVFYRCDGWVHKSIPYGNYAIEAMARKIPGYSVTLSDDLAMLTDANLAAYDLLVFNNTTRLVLKAENKAAILNFIKGGKGIVGIHAGSDNFADWPEGIAMMGGIFNGHPWHAKGTWAYRNDRPKHVLNSAFKGKGLIHQDEIYNYKSPIDEEAILVLMSLDTTHGKTKEVAAKNVAAFNVEHAEDVENPVSWCRQYGKGRLFYTNFGHRKETYSHPKIMKHLMDGIQFATGDLRAQTDPKGRPEG
jgi:type 1 glutamine amidotransferase